MPTNEIPAGSSGYIDDIKAKQKVTVRFEASAGNNKTTSVTVGWIPQGGVPIAQLPPAVILTAAPGAAVDHAGTVPDPAQADRLEIKVQAPGNGGRLIVTQDPDTWRGEVVADVTWDFNVL